MNVQVRRARPLAVVTGMGLVTSLGSGKQDNWAALTSGKSGIRRIKRFPTDHLKTTIAGMVDYLPASNRGAGALTAELAETAAEEAVAQAGISGDFDGPLFLAAPPVEIEWQHRLALNATLNAGQADAPLLAASRRAGGFEDIFDATQFGTIAQKLMDRFGTRGLPVTLSTACASGATAIQLAVDSIRRGETERALAVAADGSATAESLIRFSLLSALSMQNEAPHRASKPFSRDRDGFVMAEGSAALVIETPQSAKARGAKILGVVMGVGDKADDFHRTRSKPDGSPAIAAVRSAIADAAIEPQQIDYINAHGTSTPENDKMEALSMSAVFGNRMGELPISSNKSMIGHTLSAAGAVEAVISLLTMREGRIPPTINHDNPDPAIPLDVVPNVARDAEVATVLSNSFGFGGQNVCLVLAREPV
ncbi:MAG: beta-ketoacyl-ACP synthase [Rhizobiaceae bacterium]|nr:beta-ketoacyl-ACP synthase [Rhizobiaceae bacterium]